MYLTGGGGNKGLQLATDTITDNMKIIFIIITVLSWAGNMLSESESNDNDPTMLDNLANCRTGEVTIPIRNNVITFNQKYDIMKYYLNFIKVKIG